MKRLVLMISLLGLLWTTDLWAAETAQKVYAIRDLDLSRQEEAQQLAEDVGQTLLIFYNEAAEEIFPVSFEQMGIKTTAVTLENKNGLDRLIGSHYGIALSWQREALKEAIVRESQFINTKPSDAYLKIGYDNSVTIVPEVIGETLNEEAMVREAEEKISPYGPLMLSLKTIKTAPEKTAEDLARLNIESLLGEFSTRFNGADTKRTNNIWLATTQIEEVFVMPGEEFSFNEAVGPRTKERGFSEAGVIVNNQHQKDYGGGVCQVSSTLFNAAEAAKMTIIERHSHSMSVSYVKKGRDAAVVYGEKDLRFRNDTDNPILIKSYFAYGKLTIKIFGKSPQ